MPGVLGYRARVYLQPGRVSRDGAKVRKSYILVIVMKDRITRLLEKRVKQLFAKYHPKVVAVTGSVGKTTTKIAIATVLSEKYRVQVHYSNYNTPIALPLSIFGLTLPRNLKSPFAWFKIFRKMKKIIARPFPYDVIVVELGTDHPGDIEYFKQYIHPDISVVTAVAPEHMENFKDLNAVAREELTVASFSDLTLINRDDVSAEYTQFVPDGINIDTYGSSGVAEYHFLVDKFAPATGYEGKFVSPEFGELPLNLKLIGEHNIRNAVAAGLVGIKLGLGAQEVAAGMSKIHPMPGRMNLLRGIDNSTIIDDTYNSSPTAAIAALQTLYLMSATQRIAILGSMNELGDYSARAHNEVGKACDPKMLDWVITIGAEARIHLEPAAGEKGCQTRSFNSPYDAGAFAHSVLQRGAVVLVKGSQNGVFAEEAIKEILHATEDEELLVRQTPDWLAIKQSQFEKFK